MSEPISGEPAVTTSILPGLPTITSVSEVISTLPERINPEIVEELSWPENTLGGRPNVPATPVGGTNTLGLGGILNFFSSEKKIPQEKNPPQTVDEFEKVKSEILKDSKNAKLANLPTIFEKLLSNYIESDGKNKESWVGISKYLHTFVSEIMDARGKFLILSKQTNDETRAGIIRDAVSAIFYDVPKDKELEELVVEKTLQFVKDSSLYKKVKSENIVSSPDNTKNNEKENTFENNPGNTPTGKVQLLYNENYRNLPLLTQLKAQSSLEDFIKTLSQEPSLGLEWLESLRSTIEKVFLGPLKVQNTIHKAETDTLIQNVEVFLGPSLAEKRLQDICPFLAGFIYREATERLNQKKTIGVRQDEETKKEDLASDIIKESRRRAREAWKIETPGFMKKEIAERNLAGAINADNRSIEDVNERMMPVGFLDTIRRGSDITTTKEELATPVVLGQRQALPVMSPDFLEKFREKINDAKTLTILFSMLRTFGEIPYDYNRSISGKDLIQKIKNLHDEQMKKNEHGEGNAPSFSTYERSLDIPQVAGIRKKTAKLILSSVYKEHNDMERSTASILNLKGTAQRSAILRPNTINQLAVSYSKNNSAREVKKNIVLPIQEKTTPDPGETGEINLHELEDIAKQINAIEAISETTAKKLQNLQEKTAGTKKEAFVKYLMDTREAYNNLGLKIKVMLGFSILSFATAGTPAVVTAFAVGQTRGVAISGNTTFETILEEYMKKKVAEGKKPTPLEETARRLLLVALSSLSHNNIDSNVVPIVSPLLKETDTPRVDSIDPLMTDDGIVKTNETKEIHHTYLPGDTLEGILRNELKNIKGFNELTNEQQNNVIGNLLSKPEAHGLGIKFEDIPKNLKTGDILNMNLDPGDLRSLVENASGIEISSHLLSDIPAIPNIEQSLPPPPPPFPMSAMPDDVDKNNITKETIPVPNTLGLPPLPLIKKQDPTQTPVPAEQISPEKEVADAKKEVYSLVNEHAGVRVILGEKLLPFVMDNPTMTLAELAKENKDAYTILFGIANNYYPNFSGEKRTLLEIITKIAGTNSPTK